LLSERKTIEYLAKFKKCLKDKNLSPKAQAVAIACVRSFYKAFDIQLSSSIGKLRKAKALRENQHFLTREDILKLVTNAKSLRDKAIILCMASSGMARQEIINLRVKDIEFDENGIGTVSIRRQKSQTDYVTFISPEAGKAMKNYFDERNRSEQLKIKGENDFVFVTHDIGRRGKPSTFTFIFWQMAKQLGYSNGGF
jgi:integrase